MSKWVTRYLEHRESFSGISLTNIRKVPISREKVCDCGGTLADFNDELCPSCISPRLHAGEFVIPRSYGTTNLRNETLFLDPSIEHITRPITNKCKYCGTKNPCASNRCSSCGAPL